MKNITKIVGIAVLVAVIGFSLAVCGTMFHTRSVAVNSMSGAAVTVRVMEDGVPIYDGPLPATVKVKGAKKNYTIFYTTKNGEPASIAMKKSFNGWFVADILMFPPIGFIVDFVNGNMYTLDKTVTLPISYQANDEIPFGMVAGIPAEQLEGLTLVGNIYANGSR